MNLVADQLVALTSLLTPVCGAPPEDQAELRRFIAAILIQQNPGVVLPSPGSLDPDVAAALAAGTTLAAEFQGAGVRARFQQANELTSTIDAERPAHVFGPFLDTSGNISRFFIFITTTFREVHFRLGNANPAPPVEFKLPASTTPRAGNQVYDFSGGSVWIAARWLKAGVTGMAGVRVTGGTLTVNGPTQFLAGRILLDSSSKWTLSLQVEQPQAGEAALTLPSLLEVHSSGAPTVSGNMTVSGFGSSLSFDTPGPAGSDGTAISFPFDTATQTWTITSNASPAAQFNGEFAVTSAVWALPISSGVSSLGETAHGGTIALVLKGSASMQLAGVSGGSFRFEDALLSINDEALNLETRQASSSGRMELELWTPSLSRVTFGGPPVTRLVYRSERERGDIALVHEGGVIRNRWDLPFRATGKPFGFEGGLVNFAVLSRGGQAYLAALANQVSDNSLDGVALENLYLTVQIPSRLALVGTFDRTASVADGVAILFFTVLLAQPTLPDPYAASWSAGGGAGQANAFSITLNWAGSVTPSLLSRLLQPVLFPEVGAVPPDEDADLRLAFDTHLGTHREALSMLDLSSNDQLFGVAFESPARLQPSLRHNQLELQLNGVRLLMQPQVLWEPVQASSIPLESSTNGARTLAGTSTVKLVPVLPGAVAQEWVQAAQRREVCGAMFSLPFGLRAFARLETGRALISHLFVIDASLHSVDFDSTSTSALQVRLEANRLRPVDPPPPPEPSRTMPGSLRQLNNLKPNAANLKSVLDDPTDATFAGQLQELNRFLPLHHADLSGYGLSTFSDWRRDAPAGVTQVRFDVLSGRTSLEVIQARTILAPCQAHLVRTIMMERRNSGKVLRFDTGWVAVDDGMFAAPVPFEKGAIIGYRKIRRVRAVSKPTLISGTFEWQEVLYDCDAELEDVISGGINGRVALHDQKGFIQVKPAGPGSDLTAAAMAALFAMVSGPVGGAVDCGMRIGKTLDMQVSGIFADASVRENGGPTAFIVAAYGVPKLARAGQWTAVRLSGKGDASAVDPRQGVPVIRRTGQPFTFRDPADANRNTPSTEYAFLMCTPTSRILFPKPSVLPGENLVRTGPPMMADPMAMAQSAGVFPRAAYALKATKAAAFAVSAINDWRITDTAFALVPPQPDLAKGGDWAIGRLFPGAPSLNSVIDSALGNKAFDVGLTPSEINVDVGDFGTVFKIKTNYQAIADEAGKLLKPTLEFGDQLNDLKSLLNSLEQFKDLGLAFNVDVSEGTGPSPSFIVTIDLKFRLGEGPNERIDVGLGKFLGEFHVNGRLEAALNGSTRGRLLAEFQGDIQQAIIPPLVYGGGLFRFAVEIKEDGSPSIELGLGITTSFGGDLIKDLVEVEVTIGYGYTLTEKLQPGVLLDLEARAKLLGGLIGFSFAVHAVARILRLAGDLDKVVVRAGIRVVASIQIAWLIDEDVDMQTQFEQNIPLRLALLPLGGGALALTAAI